MSFTYATMATDFFRVSYQGIDAANLNEPGEKISERISQAMKKHIAFIDAFFIFEEYVLSEEAAPGVARYNAWLTTPFRIVSIAQGIYHLQTDPNADTQSIKQDILLNLVNIGRVAMASLGHSETNPSTQKIYHVATLAFTLADLAVRMNALYSNRTVIADQIKGSYDHVFIHVFGKIIEGGFRYLLGAALSAKFISEIYSIGYILTTHSNLSKKTILEVTGWVALSAPLALIISMSMQKIFDDMGLQRSANRRLIALVVSHIATAALMGAVAVSLGYAGSISEIFKPLYPALLTVTLAYSIAYLLKTGMSQMLNLFGMQPDDLRNLGEWSFSIVSSLTLTAFAAAGFGITKSVSGSVDLYFRIFSVALGALFIGISFALTAGILLLGVPTWKDPMLEVV